MHPKKAKYVPVVRTRDAEIKGFENLSKKTIDKLLPVIEFTQSRRSKTNPIGAVSRSIEKIHTIIGEHEYIADLTSLKNQQNSEIVELLDPTNGFRKWTTFVDEKLPEHCIPTVHLTIPFDTVAFKHQVERLAKSHEYVAIRMPTAFDQYPEVLTALDEFFGNFNKVIILLDAGYVEPRVIKGAVARLSEMLEACQNQQPINCATLASSFPSSVVASGYGGDEYGRFNLSEVMLSKQLKAIFSDKKVIHGDYASIHPLDFDGTVTNWVPRVDCPLDEQLYYYRYRRDDGGYIKAAKCTLEDKAYVDLDCWGCENIKDAARKDPQGRSPAHWISVRLNIHISRQILRLVG